MSNQAFNEGYFYGSERKPKITVENLVSESRRQPFKISRSIVVTSLKFTSSHPAFACRALRKRVLIFSDSKSAEWEKNWKC